MNALEALYRCQRAWEATQPQLFMELYPDVGLDDEHGAGECDPAREAVLVVEPAVAASPVAGGLTVGDAEQSRAVAHGELTVPRVAPPLPLGGGSASPLTNTTGPGRTHPQGTSGQGQEVQV